MSDKEATADCGAKFEHTSHLYRTPRGKIKACDGSITKRNPKEKS